MDELARPAWFLAMWGPDTDWAFVRIVWFWAIVFLKFVTWLMALAAIGLTLSVSQSLSMNESNRCH